LRYAVHLKQYCGALSSDVPLFIDISEGDQITAARFWRSERVKPRKTDTMTNSNNSVRLMFAAG